MGLSFHRYQSTYADDSLRGTDVTQRPNLAQDIAASHGNAKKLLLDVGCGLAQKLQLMAKHFNLAIGLEPSVDMLYQANKNIGFESNIWLTRGIGQTLPFKDQSFDVVTAILSWWNPQEIYRVLKPDGIFLCECLGPEDKIEFTKYFGQDDNGWRGANLNTNLLEMTEDIRTQLSFFTKIDIENQHWKTAYSHQGLWQLLNSTYKTVRNFNSKTDKISFDKAIRELDQNRQIILKQNRLVIKAVKPPPLTKHLHF